VSTAPQRVRGISRRAARLPAQAIREVMELAWAQPDAIHLEVGEPDFPTPEHVVEAAARAAREGHTRYTPNAGIPALREALAAKVGRVNGYAASADQVVVSAGGVEAIHATLTTLADPGDEVLLPDPAWPDFVQMTALLGTPARFYHQTADTDYLPDIAELEALVSERTRVLVLNSPSNPLGAVIPARRLVELVEFAERHDLWVISDECYDEINFDGDFVSTMAAAPSPRIVSIYSFSKVYAMTGWRIGYAVAPPEVAAALTRLQEPIISCVNAPTQMAALAAVTGPQDLVASMRDAYRERRDRALEVLRGGGLPVVTPQGAFYLWADIGRAGIRSDQFVRELIAQRGVAAAPGTAFGAAGDSYLRLSLASHLDQLLEGSRRLIEQVETSAADATR
jgi:aspartate/methionine/tyrosine aminotransferase